MTITHKNYQYSYDKLSEQPERLSNFNDFINFYGRIAYRKYCESIETINLDEDEELFMHVAFKKKKKITKLKPIVNLELGVTIKVKQTTNTRKDVEPSIKKTTTQKVQKRKKKEKKEKEEKRKIEERVQGDDNTYLLLTSSQSDDVLMKEVIETKCETISIKTTIHSFKQEEVVCIETINAERATIIENPQVEFIGCFDTVDSSTQTTCSGDCSVCSVLCHVSGEIMKRNLKAQNKLDDIIKKKFEYIDKLYEQPTESYRTSWVLLEDDEYHKVMSYPNINKIVIIDKIRDECEFEEIT
jgi:DNA repair exonuclease SbcCD nuclease subunit